MNKNIFFIGTISILAITGIAVANTGNQEEDITLGCKINESTQNGMIKLESVYKNEEAGAGIYKVSIRTVSGSNKVNSTQKGEFTKKAGETAILGKTKLSGHGQSYEVKIDVTFNGKRYKCSEVIKTSV